MTIERAEEEGIQCGYCLLLPKALESQSKASFLNPTATRAHAHNLPKLGVRGTGAGKGAGEGFGGGEDKDEETDNSSFMICATRSAPSPLQHFFSAPSSLCTVATSGVALCNSKPPPPLSRIPSPAGSRAESSVARLCILSVRLAGPKASCSGWPAQLRHLSKSTCVGRVMGAKQRKHVLQAPEHPNSLKLEWLRGQQLWDIGTRKLDADAVPSPRL